MDVRGPLFLCICLLGPGCDRGAHAQDSAPPPAPRRSLEADGAGAPVAAALGVADVGIFSDLDGRVRLALPKDIGAGTVKGVVVPDKELLVLYHGGWPVKVYPLTGDRPTRVGGTRLAVRRADRQEISRVLLGARVRTLGPGESPAPGDSDRDGIPDPLDILIGAKKTVLNGAAYGAGYIHLSYPGGDVPRHQGVCTDVVIRSVRNAGTDLQQTLHTDIKRAPKRYPMVKRANPHIDQRRVKTLLPYFKRHWDARAKKNDDRRDPYRPGDVVFMDTFPSRPGPDHIGIVSNTLGDSGLPLIVNNWTNGSRTAELDLLTWVPVTHRFRVPADRPSASRRR